MAKRLEQLTEDILDDEFVNIFKPIHKVQLIFGCLYVQIKHGFITAPSKSIEVYSIIVWSVNLFMHYFHNDYCNYYTTPAIWTELHHKLAYHVLFFLELLMVIYERFVINQKRNLEMYVRLQKIDRYLDVEDRKRENRFMLRSSNAAMYFCVAVVMIWTAAYNILFVDGFCLPLLFIAWASTVSYTYGILILIVMYYISVKVKFLIRILESHVQMNSKSNLTIYHINTLNEREDCLNTKTWDKLVTSVHLIVTVISDFLYLYQHKVCAYFYIY